MNTAPRISEGTRSAITIAEYATRNAMPQPYLLDTGTDHFPDAGKKIPPKLRLIKPAPASAMCGFGTCALDPACTGKCRYNEADENLRGHYSTRHTQRAAMPPAQPKADHKARRRTAIALIAWSAACLAGAAWWAFA